MNTHVVVLAAVTVLLHVPAGRGFSVKSRNSEHQFEAGDGTGMKQVSGESDVSNQDLDAGDFMLVKESVGNDLHDIRRREARSKKRSGKRQGESGDGSGMDQEHEADEKMVMKRISDILQPQKEMIINFMKPILDRIKHKPKKPSPDNSSDSSASPSTPDPSPTPSDPEASHSSDSDASNSSDSDASDSSDSDASNSDASDSSDSDASNSSDSDASDSSDSNASNSSNSDASNSNNSDTSKPSYSSANNIWPFLSSFSKCDENQRQRSMNTLSLLFPDLQSDEDEQPFVFVPLANTLMRVVEQQIIGESKSGGYPTRRLHN